MVAAAIIVSVVAAIVAAAIGSSKNRSALGFFLFGLLFWPGAIITALIISPGEASPRSMRGRSQGQVDQALVECGSCGAMTPTAVSFCTACKAQRA